MLTAIIWNSTESYRQGALRKIVIIGFPEIDIHSFVHSFVRSFIHSFIHSLRRRTCMYSASSRLRPRSLHAWLKTYRTSLNLIKGVPKRTIIIYTAKRKDFFNDL